MHILCSEVGKPANTALSKNSLRTSLFAWESVVGSCSWAMPFGVVSPKFGSVPGTFAGTEIGDNKQEQHNSIHHIRTIVSSKEYCHILPLHFFSHYALLVLFNIRLRVLYHFPLHLLNSSITTSGSQSSRLTTMAATAFLHLLTSPSYPPDKNEWQVQ